MAGEGRRRQEHRAGRYADFRQPVMTRTDCTRKMPRTSPALRALHCHGAASVSRTVPPGHHTPASCARAQALTASTPTSAVRPPRTRPTLPTGPTCSGARARVCACVCACVCVLFLLQCCSVFGADALREEASSHYRATARAARRLHVASGGSTATRHLGSCAHGLRPPVSTPLRRCFCRWAREHHRIFVPSLGPGYHDGKIRPWNMAARREREGIDRCGG